MRTRKPITIPSAALRVTLLFKLLSLITLLLTAPAEAADSGVIVGSVSNAASGNMLEGVRLSLPKLGLSALTDNTGRFVLPNVPPGTHEIVASYIGLDPMKFD